MNPTKLIVVNDRACVGKSLANMELQVFIATIFRRYTFVPEDPNKPVGRLTLINPSPIEFFACSPIQLRDLSVDLSRVELV